MHTFIVFGSTMLGVVEWAAVIWALITLVDWALIAADIMAALKRRRAKAAQKRGFPWARDK